MPDAYLLHQYPAAMVRIACRKCPRYGQYRKGNLIVKFGASQNLPSMLQLIAKCERASKFQGCGAYYLDQIDKLES
jgi:hypothetical protein